MTETNGDRMAEAFGKAFSFSSVKDSGTREEFPTGSRRDSREGKGRYDLLPPHAVKRLAIHFENGAKKYGENNWEKGQPLKRFNESALRHIFNHMEGDRSEDHLAAAVWNLMAWIETEEKIRQGKLPKELAE